MYLATRPKWLGSSRLYESILGHAKCSAAMTTRLRSSVPLPLHPRPAVQAQALLRQVARLVAHLLRALDPIAEIDVGQAEAARFLDVVENDEAPERPARDVGIVKGIDQRQAVGEAVGQADREQWPRAGLITGPAPRAIFGQHG